MLFLPRLVALGGAALLFSPLAAQIRWQPDPGSVPVVPRTDARMVHDPARDVLLLTGGWNGTQDLDQTWTFDGSAWTQLQPAHSPGTHSSHGLAWDAARGQAVLFGGWDAGGLRPAETWEWDGQDWRQRRPAQSPPARASAAMAYDPLRQRVVLFGGTCGNGCALGDTWEWDGNDWRLVPTPGPGPVARYSAAFAWDAARGQLLLFGGRTLSARVADTWAYDHGGWRQLAPAHAPSPRSAAGLAADTSRGRLVLFGGYDGSYRNDTWEWDGSDWLLRQPVGSPPAPRAFAVMAYDAARATTWLVGGAAGPTMQRDAWRLGAVQPAAADPFGSGCPNPGAPTLRLADDALPWLGDRLTVELLAASPALLRPVLWLGETDQGWHGLRLPLDLVGFGLPGCTLLVAPRVPEAMTPDGSRTRATFALSVPNSPALLGSRAFLQASDLSNAGGTAGLALSNGLALTLGGR